MRFYDDGSFYDQFFAYGHEFGTVLVIRTDDESTAYDIAIDESPTIASDEVHEAYGFYLMQAKSCFAPDNGEKWYICSDTEFGQMVSESVLKCRGDRQCIGEYVETEPYGIFEFRPEFDTREDAIKFVNEFIRENGLDLIEGYQYQSNFTGTGIVNVGHYVWIRVANDEEIAAFKQAIPDEVDE
jgi:hypothetical protein